MRYLEVPSPIVLDVRGQDSQRYLNARLTKNIKTLAVGESSYAAALSPQGKTQGLFSVWHLEDNRFLVISDGGDPDAIIPAFKKYLVADRVHVEDVSTTYSLFHILPDAFSAQLSSFLSLSELPSREGQIVTSRPQVFISGKQRGWGVGLELVIAKEKVAELRGFLSSLRAYEFSRSDATFARLLKRIPSFPEEVNEQTLFSEAQFEWAVSINKGCYVGQEVIEKVEAIGKSARILQLIDFEGCPVVNLGAPVLSKDSDSDTEISIGKALTSAWNPQTNRTLCFASIRNDESLKDREVIVDGNLGRIVWK